MMIINEGGFFFLFVFLERKRIQREVIFRSNVGIRLAHLK